MCRLLSRLAISSVLAMLLLMGGCWIPRGTDRSQQEAQNPMVIQKLAYYSPAQNLLELAKVNFPNISDEGILLIDAVGKGSTAVFDSKHKPLDSCYIEFLCRHVVADWIPPNGINIRGASVHGRLGLYGRDILFPIDIRDSTFDDEISLESAHLRALYLYGCRMASVTARRIDVDQDIQLRENCVVKGPANFYNAKIKGSLHCRGSHFLDPCSPSLNLYGSQISGSVFLGEGFSAAAGVSLTGSRIDGSVSLADKPRLSGGCLYLNDARIGGSLECFGAAFLDRETDAISGEALKVEGRILLSDVNSLGRIDFRNATVQGEVICQGGFLSSSGGCALDLSNTHLASRLSLSPKRVKGQTNLIDARIGGDLCFSDANFANEKAESIIAQGVIVGGRLLLQDVNCIGKVDLMNATVQGDLSCSYCALSNPSSIAILLNGSHLRSSLLITKQTQISGVVGLVGAEIGGDIDSDASLFSNPGGVCFNCAGMRTTGRVFLDAKSRFEGQVFLEGAYIRSDCFLRDSDFVNHNGPSVCAPGLQIDGRLLILRSHFSGQCYMPDARIMRCLQIEDTALAAPNGPALDASNLRVETGLQVHDANFVGGILLVGGIVGGDLEFRKSRITQSEGYGLDASRVNASGSILFSDGFASEGNIVLTGAHAGADIAFTGASTPTRITGALVASGTQIGRDVLIGKNSQITGDVNFSTSDIGGHLVIEEAIWHPGAHLDLRFAKVHILEDNEGSWPDPNKLCIDGLEYDVIAGSVSLDERLRWLALQDRKAFFSQPYEQLAKYLRSHGREKDADQVLIEKNRRYGAYRTNDPRLKGVLWWLWYSVIGPKIGYGYDAWGLLVSPFKPTFWHLFLCIPFWIVTGAIFFGFAKRWGALVRRCEAEHVCVDGAAGKAAPAHPEFHAFVYSLDKFIPLINLGQSHLWIPSAVCCEGPPPLEAKHRSRFRRTVRRLLYQLFYFYYWVYILFGWVLSTLLIVAMAGLIKK